jgi:uncharacterized protein
VTSSPTASPPAAASWGAPVPWTLPGAQRHVLTTSTGDRWRVDVALPAPSVRDAAGPGPYPVLYVLDGNATFAVTAQVASHTLGEARGTLLPAVVVGLSRDTDDWQQMQAQRLVDLSPRSVDDLSAAYFTRDGYGGADDLLALLAHTVLPFVEAAYPVRADDRGLAGWSLGGLFAWYALVTRPGLFRRCLAVSPSLAWYRRTLMDADLLAQAGLDGTDVYLAAGEHESDPDRTWPRPPEGFSPEAAARIKSWRVSENVLELADLLRRRGGVSVQADVIGGEQHGTVWAAAVTRGLVHLYRTDRGGTP